MSVFKQDPNRSMTASEGNELLRQMSADQLKNEKPMTLAQALSNRPEKRLSDSERGFLSPLGTGVAQPAAALVKIK